MCHLPCYHCWARRPQVICSHIHETLGALICEPASRHGRLASWRATSIVTRHCGCPPRSRACTPSPNLMFCGRILSFLPLACPGRLQAGGERHTAAPVVPPCAPLPAAVCTLCLRATTLRGKKTLIMRAMPPSGGQAPLASFLNLHCGIASSAAGEDVAPRGQDV